MIDKKIEADSIFDGSLKKFGIGALSVLALVDIGIIGTVVVDQVRGEKGNDMWLIMDGGHLKPGDHKFIITDQFYSHLKYEDELDQNLVINSFKTVYDNLNYYNSNKIHFTLCTTNSEASEKYQIPKISSYTKYDVPLYIADGDINGNEHTGGETSMQQEMVTRYLKDESIIFKKNLLFAVYKGYENPDDLYAPSNSLAYTICAHETMHAMGFAHRSKDSILYPYIPSPYKDFTELDRELMVKYNQTFYNATPEYLKNKDNADSVAQPENSYTYTSYNDDLSR